MSMHFYEATISITLETKTSYQDQPMIYKQKKKGISRKVVVLVTSLF